MKKKSVNLVTAVGVLVILSGAYVGVKTYVAKQEEKESESEEADESQEIISLASDDISSIKFVIDKKEVTFEKDGDTWIKSDESGFPVDQDKIDDLASTFSSVKAERTIEDVEDASEYELDQPENTITVTTENGESTVIRLGMENDSTSQEYIDLNGDSSTVYVVGSSTFQSFEGSLYDFAKSGTFPTVDSSTVSKISVNENSGDTPVAYSVEKDENNFWDVTDIEADGTTETEKADSAKATSLASAVSSMAYSSYVNYNCSEEELGQYGLDKPYAEITVDYQEEVEVQKSEEAETEEATDGEVEAVENADTGSVENTTAEDADTGNMENASVEDENAGNGENTSETNNTSETGSESATEASETSEPAQAETDTEESIEENTEEAASEDTQDIADETAADADTTEDSEETETKMEDRELTILVGDQASDGGRYVQVNGSEEIYTISEDSLNTFISKTNADFWDMTVSYVSVNNLESLGVNYKGNEYTVDVSRETSEETSEEESEKATSDEEVQNETDAESDSAEKEESSTVESNAADVSSSSDTNSSENVTLSYKLNGNELDSTTFTTYYNKLINMAAQKRLTDKFETNTDPEMQVVFNTTDGTQETVAYYSYDTNYYAAVVGEKVYLINKMNVKDMFTAFEEVAGLTESSSEDED